MTAILTSRPCPAGRSAPPEPPPHLVVLEGGRSLQRLEASHRRRRGVALALFLMVSFGALAGVRAGVAAVTPHDQVRSLQSVAPGGPIVVVRAGDTLWSIARRIQPAGDIRALVDRLVAINGGAVLQPGERFALPAS